MSGASSPVATKLRTLDLPVPAGPWSADAWLIERPLRLETSGTATCVVSACGRPAGTGAGDRPGGADVLCVAHRRRYLKQPRIPLPQFIADQETASPIRAPRGANTRKRFYPPIDFTAVAPQLAHELRYITSVKIRRAHWGTGDYVQALLRAAVHYGQQRGMVSLLAHPVDELVADIQRRLDAARSPGQSLSGYRQLAVVLPSMVRLLESATADPWDNDVWHPAELGIKMANARTTECTYWANVTCDWLRLGLKHLAKRHLQAGTRQYRTIAAYARGGRLLSRFMAEEAGEIAPHDLTRQVYLDFVSWARGETGVKTDLNAINTLARLLVEMRAERLVPMLPDTTFLLRGENPVPKTMEPKPFPADVLDQIDKMTAEDPLLPADVRLLLRVFRATGPRASEALLLPRDCIRHIDGRGYSLEYFMSKTQNWRRVPLPERLGRDLADQARNVVDTYGPNCPWLFPYAGRTPRTNTVLHAGGNSPAWAYNTFTNLVWAAYQRNGVTRSAITGEVLTGAQVHRFRHTVATGLLNEGWSQYEVQQFLGHRSATMVQAYAEIHEDKLRAKYDEFVKHAIDVTGQRHQVDVGGAATLERIRDRMIRTTLPNGYCTLPEKQTCDFVPTPCLSCKPFFRTTPTFLPIHIRQRDEALRELELAKEQGRHRAIQAHEQTVDRLNVIIVGLEAAKNTTPTEEAS